jgi:FkbM family methyltransferase
MRAERTGCSGYAAGTTAAVARRWGDKNLVRKGVYRVGLALGDRVLMGKTRGGSVMALSMRDVFHRRIYFYGEYEAATTALFRRIVTPGSTVFDVGANAGYFSILSCELGAARVRAFEPNPNVRSLLERSATFQQTDIEVVAAACSDHAGTMPFYLSNPRNTGASSLTRVSDAAVEVEVITLDDYAERTNTRPDVVKVDAEAHEYEVLAGAQRLLTTTRPTVVVEVVKRRREEVIELMVSYGYTPRRILDDGSTDVHGPRPLTGLENICFEP